MNKKQKVIDALYKACKKRRDPIFSNDEVKSVCQEIGFSNPFDATKFDNSSLLPESLLADDVYVEHVGEGWHRFVPGIESGFHTFEEIGEAEKHPWKYRPSLLNEHDKSESNILSVGFNQRILHDFLYEDIVANPKLYMSRRTTFTGSYKIRGDKVCVNRLQMEIDMVLENRGEITIVEGKNNFPKDFAVYQLFHPHLYYNTLKDEQAVGIADIQCCYLLRRERVLRLYLYRFHGVEKTSLELIKKAEYTLRFRA